MIHLFYINFLLSLSIYSTMETFHHILKLSAGVGLFFFIYLLEESLKTFLGRVLNFFTTHYKECDWRRYRGAIVTGILQSSSMVSFMVPRFCGLEYLP
jgi:phosphate:Na+ symporter